MTAQAIIDQIRDQGALFNVRTEKLKTASGVDVGSRVAIINETTGQPIGLVSPSYKLVTNNDVVTHLAEALEKSSLDLTDAAATVRSSHGGARTMLDIVLPKHEISLGGDRSQMRISALNSYDGRWKYMTRGGAIRMACLNGQIMGNFIGSYVEYHNSKLDVSVGAERLVRMSDDFLTAEKWWRQMIDRKVDREQMLRSISVFLNGESKIKDRAEFEKKPSVRKLIELYETYSVEMGANAYALYNAMTDFVSHKRRKPDTEAAALLLDQEKLSRAINRSKVFAYEEV